MDGLHIGLPRALRLWFVGVERRRLQSQFAIVAALFLLYYLVGVGLSIRSLSFPWVWDDLHLVRVYSTDELKSVFVGNWDVDGIETPGYRPLTTVFNHLRALILGENTSAHRLFDIGLVAAWLALFSNATARLGFPYPNAAIGCVLALTSRYNFFNLVWIADGVHAFTAFWIVLAVLSLLAHLARPAKWKLAACVLTAGLALFTREDALAALTLVPAFALCCILRLFHDDRVRWSDLTVLHKPSGDARLRSSLWTIARTTAALGIVVLFFFILRSIVVPQAFSRFNPGIWLDTLYVSIFPPGELDPVGNLWLHRAWDALLLLLAIATLVSVPHKVRWQAIFWLACMLFVSTFGFTLVRINLLFLPTLFFSLYLVTVLSEMANKSKWMSLTVAIFLGVLLVLNTSRNLIAQTTIDPSSLTLLWMTHDTISRPRATVPAGRLAEIKTHWARLGIFTEEDFQRLYPLLLAQAREQGWREPDASGHLFLPVLDFLQP